MKKEYTAVVAISLFLFAYVLEALAGQVTFPAFTSPFAFLNPTVLNKYPFTATAIAIRTAAIIISVVLILSFAAIKKHLKAVIVFVLGVLLELYAIQQLATGMKVTPLEWTLSFAYSAVLFAPIVVFFLTAGAFEAAHKALTKPDETLPQENT